MHKGIVGILLLAFIVIASIGGYLYLKSNPQVLSQAEQEIQKITQSTSSTDVKSPFSLARDQDRREAVKAISDAVFQYTSEHKGILPKDYPTEETCIGTSPSCYNLKTLLVPIYVDEIPLDPKTGNEANTGFVTYLNSDGRVVVRIKGEENGVFEIVR